MSEQRKKCASVCLKTEALGALKIEIYPAALWDGPESAYRVRQGGKWRDGTRGAWRFYTPPELAELLTAMLLGARPHEDGAADASPDTPPEMPKGARVSVATPHGYVAAWIDTEKPFRGFDGRWYVGCHMAGRGVVMVPCNEVIIVRRKH